MISASSAHAQSKGQPIPESQLDLAIGWLDLIKGKTDLDALDYILTHESGHSKLTTMKSWANYSSDKIDFYWDNLVAISLFLLQERLYLGH